MIHERKSLPYTLSALAPYISAETMEIHSTKHHQTYVDNLNKLIVGTPHESQSLEEIIRSATGPIFNNAAQVWNHTFYFDGLAPAGSAKLDGDLKSAIVKKWGSEDVFKMEFTKVALATFGSGWTWLILEADGTLAITSTSNAATPLTTDAKPLLTCDVWEHAYYVDTRNARAKYLENYWSVVNWAVVMARYAA